jgi:hypothetical protein
MQVMELRKRILGEKHPDPLNSMVNPAYTLQSQGRCREATNLMMHVERLRCEQAGSGNPNLYESLYDQLGVRPTSGSTGGGGSAAAFPLTTSSCHHVCIRLSGRLRHRRPHRHCRDRPVKRLHRPRRQTVFQPRRHPRPTRHHRPFAPARRLRPQTLHPHLLRPTPAVEARPLPGLGAHGTRTLRARVLPRLR